MLTGNIPVQGLHAKRGALCLGQGGGGGEEVDFPFCL